MLAIKGTALYFSCVSFDPASWMTRQLCRSTDAEPLRVLDGSRYWGVIGASLKLGPRGELYVVDMYNIHRSERGGKNWRTLGKKGIPDSYSGVVQ